jgi:hypothetical protein
MAAAVCTDGTYFNNYGTHYHTVPIKRLDAGVGQFYEITYVNPMFGAPA